MITACYFFVKSLLIGRVYPTHCQGSMEFMNAWNSIETTLSIYIRVFMLLIDCLCADYEHITIACTTRIISYWLKINQKYIKLLNSMKIYFLSRRLFENIPERKGLKYQTNEYRCEWRTRGNWRVQSSEKAPW